MKFKDLVIYNLLVESFQEEGLLFTESIELSKILQDIVKDELLGEPKPPVKSKDDDAPIKVDLKDDQQLRVDDGSKIQEIKIGKVLQRMWPYMNTSQSNRIIGRIRAKILENEIKFTIEDNVSEWYKRGMCGKVTSCMTDKPELTKFYDTQDSLKIVIAWRNKEPIGRALLWHNVKHGTKKITYLDQVYPNDDNTIKELFKAFADKNKWTFFTAKENLALVYTLENKDKIDKIPYLDTFRYGTLGGQITNINDYKFLDIYYHFDSPHGRKILKFPDWISQANLGPDVTLVPVSNNKVIFDSGTWINGTWEDGHWMAGLWKNGIWKNGIWEKGNWRDGIWENGQHQRGTWENGTWKDGYWYVGVWINGTWENGIWQDGTWHDGTWKNGTWKNGFWAKGTWEDGKWVDGSWYSGTWKNGTWKIGWIYDPDKKGNFKSDWKWAADSVKSPISPKEYFAKNKEKK